jgi:hypothetical protein
MRLGLFERPGGAPQEAGEVAEATSVEDAPGEQAPSRAG